MTRTHAYRVTRDVPADAPYNTTGRALQAGEVFYANNKPTYGCCDYDNAAVIVNRGAFAEIPLDAVEALS